MSRLRALASRLRRPGVGSPPREPDGGSARGPRTRRARAWAGLYRAFVEERE